jgi:LDH2 family malate/lactate/ureidoglycolate dehydrogenase
MNLTYEALFDATVTILTGSGLQETAAGQVAESLVRANARGIHSHGVKYLKMITARINAGMMEISEQPSVIKASRAISLVDGKTGSARWRPAWP